MQKILRLSLIVTIVLSCTFWHAPKADCANTEIKTTRVPLKK